MKILALEFSSPRRSVAVARRHPDGTIELLAQRQETGGRSSRAMSLIEECLAEARIGREEIDCLAVGLGPGSYTGIRASLALAQGWHLARGTKVVGLTSFELLTHQARSAGIPGPVAFAIDAQRHEFYFGESDLAPGPARAGEPFRIVAAALVSDAVAGGLVVLSPDATLIPGAREFFPEAEAAAILAASRNEFRAPEDLEPIYLRAVSFVKSAPPRTEY